ncbi:MAG: hypothetical protein ALECFALPRED_007995 [Alectoria fallacina]|uniref:Kinesin motor domain-containing protein n=1 Tax=Alectoria fallacina TaxID=1903189 RepID=A0A8H3PDV6_9LECA|nr:MAG: hypothetical protein ALECFALPRED_007995 [Alectoria fallacina]
MASSPPSSPPPARPMSAILQPGRSQSRMSYSSKQGGGSRNSDEDGRIAVAVKVAVRIRPPLRPNDPGFEIIPQRFQRSMVLDTSSTSLAIETPHGQKLFLFDRVFGEGVHQEGIWQYVNESVDAFVQGYNVSVLAYGQSGSGKSYTMGTSGPAEQSDPRLMGIIPRAASALFEKLAGPPTLRRSGSSSLRTPTRFSMHSTTGLAALAKAQAQANEDKNWQMKATYVEIYNEQLRDLLVPESVPLAERTTVAIREDVKGRILLTGLHQVNINSIEDLLAALNSGSSIRQTDSTAINAKSSRSHAVFSINLVQRKNKAHAHQKDKRLSMPIEAMKGTEDWVTIDSKLHFVDLAGSERLKNSGASGDRAREGISINAGLASLGKVISQLSTRHSGAHISYRDSKLTRLLQDSLGGNAITYMIACVTPAEFHLSETLNTVHYAQRARNIQSKPQIQQISDENEKQAVIDRLRAEVSFLRDQISHSDRRANAPHERAERQNEREIELENHLLDAQENYTALSHRHAKLISEITKARDSESGETPTLTEAIGDSAVDRLKRSSSFAEAVEQVVLEYEKTIQSLETSLSNTRSSLATSESILLEKENKCAYAESMNQQLQSQLQKLRERDTNNEQYLHNLEAKLDGQSSGDEKSAALVLELRKEIARIRENESQCEDYISTLEERLAEADQDMELKQRELDRLEHVIERQRSLGKLDNLLYEFDHLQTNGNSKEIQAPSKPLTNGVAKLAATSTLQEAANTVIPESDDEEETGLPLTKQSPQRRNMFQETQTVRTARASPASRLDPEAQGLAQARSSVLADKLEDVTQELFDLRIRHESTVNDFEMMSAKYDEALRTLAEMQDAVDEAHHPATAESVASPTSTRPTSFLGDARVNGLKDVGQLPSSRSLSSELSLAGDSSTSLEPSADGSPLRKITPWGWSRISPREESLMQEVEELKRAHVEKDEGLKTLHGRYSELQELHVGTLDMIEELKAEVQKAKMNNPQSPTSSVIRRKSSQNVMTIDRAHRSFASLRNIAADNLDDKPDTMQSFEINLNTAMHELHQRSERVQLLEAELATLKREMDAKATMISGLTRERTSMKTSSPIDMSVVSNLHEQLLQNETQMRMLQERHLHREHELVGEIESLTRSLEHAESAKSAMPGFFPETPATSIESNDKQLGHHTQPPQDVVRLENEVSQWQQKHKAAVDSMQASEKRLLSTITDLESALASVEKMRKQAEEKARESESISANAVDLENEKSDHVQIINTLIKEIDEQKATIDSHVDRIARFEELQATAHAQVDEAARFRSDSVRELDAHRQYISMLEQKVQEHQSAVEFHKHGLKSLHDSHSRALDGLRSTIGEHAAEKADLDRNSQEMQGAYTAQISRLETEVVDLKSQLEKANSNLADELGLSKRKCEEMERQRNQLQKEVQTLKSEIAAAAKSTEVNIAELETVKSQRERFAIINDELEEQLKHLFDQQQASTSRLSMLTNNQSHINEANSQINMLEKQLDASQIQVEQLQAQLRELHRQTPERSLSNSNLRKSASVTTLPSPPPAIPLPPLPNSVTSPTSATFPHHPPSVQTHELISQHNAHLEEKDAHIKQMEKHLFAEKQLTATLEEALVDLESQTNKTKVDMEAWKKKTRALEDENKYLKKESSGARYSVQAVEEERDKRKEAERAREKLEERMRVHEGKRKKKGGGFNCF